jgi:hypothetical protein
MQMTFRSNPTGEPLRLSAADTVVPRSGSADTGATPTGYPGRAASSHSITWFTEITDSAPAQLVGDSRPALAELCQCRPKCC